MGKNVIIFGVNMSSFVNNINENKDILILGGRTHNSRANTRILLH